MGAPESSQKKVGRVWAPQKVVRKRSGGFGRPDQMSEKGRAGLGAQKMSEKGRAGWGAHQKCHQKGLAGLGAPKNVRKRSGGVGCPPPKNVRKRSGGFGRPQKMSETCWADLDGLKNCQKKVGRAWTSLEKVRKRSGGFRCS